MTGTLAFLVIVSVCLIGLALGSFANVVIARVPAGVRLSVPSRCDTCGTRIDPWHNVPVLSWVALRGRCAHCRAGISARVPAIEAATALVLLGVVWWRSAQPGAFFALAWWIELLAYGYLAVMSIILACIDIDTHRLPNAVVLPSIAVIVALFSAAALLQGDRTALVRMLAGGAILFVFYALIRAVSPRGMGGGDVKLAAVVGCSLSYAGWGALAVGAFAAFFAGGLFGAVLMALGRAKAATAIPFGPWMLLGLWVGLAVGAPLWQGYLGTTAALAQNLDGAVFMGMTHSVERGQSWLRLS